MRTELRLLAALATQSISPSAAGRGGEGLCVWGVCWGLVGYFSRAWFLV